MRFGQIALVLCACVWVGAGDVSHLQAKARLLGKLARHRKRGVLSAVPSYKLGHDIPHITHSVLKPVVVNYPPAAALTAVKVPLAHPLLPRYPVPVGHRVPVPHPHYGLRFPHQPKIVPDQHFHHHHHHVAPKPIVPVIRAPPPIPATPVVPVAQPSGTVALPVPAPPPVFAPASFPSHPASIPPPPINILPPNHGHIPLLPAAAIPFQHAPVAPVYPIAPQYQYVIRPGNAVQTSFFATYPRYPLINYQQLIPLPPPAPSVAPVFLDRPQFPHFHVAQNGIIQPTPAVAVEPTPTIIHPTQATVPIHLQPTQPVPLDHDGWSPVHHPTHTEAHFPQSHESQFPQAHESHFPQPHEAHFQQPHEANFPQPHEAHYPQPHETHFPQPHEAHLPQPQEAHFPQQHESHHFTQDQGTQVFEQHTGSDQYDAQHQLQHHIQHQLEQAQFEQHINNQHQLSQEYGAPHQLSQEEYAQHDYSQHGQEYAQQSHEYSQHGQGFAQQGQEYNLSQQQLSQEYGVPQGVEGRSLETDGEPQRYHNHIPLGLQPPIDRPLENFR